MPRLTEDEARRRFTASRVARLATVGPAGRPHQVPVTFAAATGPDRLVTAVDHKPKSTPRLRRLAHIAAHPEVCLLADAYDEDWDRLWWSRADGDARILAPGAADPAERQAYDASVALLREKYPQYRDRPPAGPVITVTVRRWSGWQARTGEPGPQNLTRP